MRIQAASRGNVQGAFSGQNSNLWLKLKHSNSNITNSGYASTRVKTNNYILGYDNKLSEKAYLGAYVALTNGKVEMKNSSININNSTDYGIYSTSILGKGAYLNYLGHAGTIRNELDHHSWNTHNWGISLEYGKKMQQGFNLYATPYIQLSYDHIKSDAPDFGGNKINSGASNNINAKLGVDFSRKDDKDNSYYTGIAYGKTFSHAPNTLVNGIPVPSTSQNSNTFYLSFGTDQKISENSTVSLDYEKTYGNTNGWSVQGKINWSF